MAQRRAAVKRNLADLAGLLYEAAAEPELWPTVLDELGDALGGAALVSGLHRPDGMAIGVSNRLDPEADKILRAQYANSANNPLMSAMPRIPVLAPVARERVMDDKAYLGSGLYNDVFRSQGFVHAALSCLARENGILIPCGVLRRENQEFDADCFRLFEQITPHLRRALELAVRFSDLRAAYRNVEAVANAGEDGYIVTDASARVLYSNAIAERALVASDGVYCRAGVLSAIRPEETARLHHLISSAALRSGYLGGDMRVSRSEDVAAWAIIVVPASGTFAEVAQSSTTPGENKPTALVRLVDLDWKTTVPVARLTALFGFSKAEAMVAIGLINGLRPEDIAEHRDLRITTVRSQIRAIYLKTGTSRQADLVRLLLRTASPLR